MPLRTSKCLPRRGGASCRPPIRCASCAKQMAAHKQPARGNPATIPGSVRRRTTPLTVGSANAVETASPSHLAPTSAPAATWPGIPRPERLSWIPWLLSVGSSAVRWQLCCPLAALGQPQSAIPDARPRRGHLSARCPSVPWSRLHGMPPESARVASKAWESYWLVRRSTSGARMYSGVSRRRALVTRTLSRARMSIA